MQADNACDVAAHRPRRPCGFGSMPAQLGPARGPLPEAARRRRGGPHGRVEQERGERDEHVVALQVLQAHLPGPPALRPGHLTALRTRTGG